MPRKFEVTIKPTELLAIRESLIFCSRVTIMSVEGMESNYCVVIEITNYTCGVIFSFNLLLHSELLL